MGKIKLTQREAELFAKRIVRELSPYCLEITKQYKAERIKAFYKTVTGKKVKKLIDDIETRPFINQSVIDSRLGFSLIYQNAIVKTSEISEDIQIINVRFPDYSIEEIITVVIENNKSEMYEKIDKICQKK